jgi:aminocarboxymuconate-semialdehyde decarboxylase
MTDEPVIDVQTHFVGPAAAALLTAFEGRGGSWHGLGAVPGPEAPIRGLDARLAAMEETGVDISVLSFAPLGLLADRGFAADLCRAANDGLLQACAAHPDRFVAAAALPLPFADEAARELERIGREPSVRAIQIVADTTRYRPDDSELEPLFGAIATLGLPVILHPTAGAADLSDAFDVYGLSSGMHAMVSHALVAARMIGSGMLDRLPRLELILNHLGGILPFLAERLDSRVRGPCAHAPSHYLRTRFFFDCCGYSAGAALRCALETVGPERLVIGSDWPSRPIAPALTAIRGLALPPEQEKAILGGNARRWFNPCRQRRSTARPEHLPGEREKNRPAEDRPGTAARGDRTRP